MPSCTCLRNPGKFVSEPKKAKDFESDLSNNSNEVQSIVTDSEVFDHEALLKQEGSTTYDGDSSSVSISSSNTYEESPNTNNDEQDGEIQNTSNVQENELSNQEQISRTTSTTSSSDESEYYDETKPQKLRYTVEKWNELLKEYDNDPDIIEVQDALSLVTKLSEDNKDEETKKKVDETIKRLTSSLVEMTSNTNSQLSDQELVLQPYEGDDEHTYFRCFLRKVQESAGKAEVELEVNDVVAENIQVLLNSLGLSKRTLSADKSNFITRMTSSIKTSSVFKNLMDHGESNKNPMNLTTYLHQLSNNVDYDDLASVSTLSELDVGRSNNAISNCLLNTSMILDEAVCDRIRRHKRDIPDFCSKQLQKQIMLKNKYEDVSDLPLFIS